MEARIMNRKERVKTVIQGKTPDFTPHHFDLTLQITDQLAKHYGTDREGAEDAIGNHLLYVDFTGPEGQDNGYRSITGDSHIYKDEFGVDWDTSSNYQIGDWGMVGHPIQDMDFEGYVFPDGTGAHRFDEATAVMALYPDRFHVLRVTGPFDLGWHLTGLEDFMVMLLLEEDLTRRVLDSTTQYLLNIIEAAPAELDAVRVIEDWGLQKGLMFSKELWMKFIHPCYVRIHDAIRKRGFHVMHHSCGDITELMPEIIGLGTEVLDAVQPEANDLAFLKREYGKDITFFGGLGSQSTLPNGTPQQVVEEAQRTLELMGRDGGYIIGPAGSVSTDTPMPNVLALIEFCQSLGR